MICRSPKISGTDTLNVILDTTVPLADQETYVGGTYTGSATGAPTISSATKTVTGVTTKVSITGTGLSGTTTAVFENVKDRNVAYDATISAGTATSADVSIDNLAAGEYRVRFHVDGKGFAVATMTPEFTVVVALSPSIVLTYESSIAGGQTLTLSGSGYSSVLSQNKVTIGGLDCPVTAATGTSLSCTLPKFSTKLTKSLYKFPENEAKVEPVAQIANEAAVDPLLLWDGATDQYYKSSAASCFVGFDFGSVRVGVTKIQFYPRSMGVLTAAPLTGGIFETSVDGVTYTQIYTLPSAHLGKNIYRPSAETVPVRFVRFRHTTC